MPGVLEPRSTNSEVRLHQKIAELESRISAMERKSSFVPVSATIPTDERSGMLQASDIAGTKRLWVNVNGTWASVVVS